MGIGNTVGLIKALAPKPDAETITAAVDAWLEDNPEATTTVEDGAISYAKLNSSLQGTVDDVSDLKNALADTSNIYKDAKPYGFATATGEDGTSLTGYWNSGLVEIPNGSALSSNVYIYKTAFYTESRQFISCNNSTHANVSIPNNTRYIKIQIQNNVVAFNNRNSVNLYVDGVQILRIKETAIAENSIEFIRLGENVQNAIGCAGGSYLYQGERINLNRLSFNYSALCSSKDAQGGCVYNGKLFHFDDDKTFRVTNIAETTIYADGTLSGSVTPHANAVTLGNKYNDSDLYPLMYVNAYNAPDLPKGTCYVYRISENDTTPKTMTATIVQTISIGFVEDPLWKSSDSDERPYGNFCVDTEHNILWVYTLRDVGQKTRFFKFNLPSISNSTVTLTTTDVIKYFDIDYIRIPQDNTYFDGKMYICSGYGSGLTPGYIRVIDLDGEKEVSTVNLTEAGITLEPEIIDIYNNRLICGNTTVYRFMF